ncbi:MAG TPA: adenylate/guanylate cyclase domain-containing protein [Mycobacteriales bacterium]|nr:adenylate/guanylate cyclase domain-containing protein [Mycobacteriales bacterium]
MTDDEIIAAVAATRWAAIYSDVDLIVRWVSPEMREILGVGPDDDVGEGLHMLEAFLKPAWVAAITPASQQVMAQMIVRIAESELMDRPPVMSGRLVYTVPGFADAEVQWMSLVIARPGPGKVGTEPAGVLIMFGSALRASVTDVLVRGSEDLLERVAALREPQRAQAAVLVADIQGSTALARGLSSSGYFRLLRELLGAVDDEVVQRNGIVSKHPGDGVVAFFRAEDCGGVSGAAHAAIAAALAIRAAVDRVVHVNGSELPLTDDDCLVDTGVHWADALHLGQVVTGGRLEVTGLGEEVNLTARLQAAARDGALLASKALVERLDTVDADALGLTVDTIRYTPVADLPGVPAKSAADAGLLPVVDLVPLLLPH